METFDGQTNIENIDQQKYLGFFLSSKGDNMVHIKEMEKKSILVSKKTFNRLYNLNLKQYLFECAMIFLNVILRSSILYASETFYNLKEKELRKLEHIEERFLRQLLKTGRGCSISQLYLETGHTPARFEVMKMRCFFFNSIIKESKDSSIFKFIMSQYQNPVRGDWVSCCLKD